MDDNTDRLRRQRQDDDEAERQQLRALQLMLARETDEHRLPTRSLGDLQQAQEDIWNRHASPYLMRLGDSRLDSPRSRLGDFDPTRFSGNTHPGDLCRLQDSMSSRRRSAYGSYYEYDAVLRASRGEPSSSTYESFLLHRLGSTGPVSRGLAYDAALLHQRDGATSSGSNALEASSILRGDDGLFGSSTTPRVLDRLLSARQPQRMFQPEAADEQAFLAAQRAALRRSVIEQEALNNRLDALLTIREQLGYHRSGQQQQLRELPSSLAGNNNDHIAALLLDGTDLHRAPALPASLDSRTNTEVDVRNDREINMPWETLIGDGGLADASLRGAVSDLHIVLMAQMRPCKLEHEDRIGLYKTRDIGFRGMCCKHCGGVTGFGRYFPGSLTSLVNGNICKSIMKHLTDECRKCPEGLRESVLKIELHDEHNPFHYRRGSRRRFFSNIWDEIQRGEVEGAEEVSVADTNASENNLGIEAPSFRNDVGIPWKLILDNSEIVQPGDRHLVLDTIFAATAQTRPCQVTEGDRVGRCKDHKLGSMGLCCKHCGGKPGAYGRYFPSNLHTFAQVEVCKQVVKHITRKCPACPLEIRQAIMDLQRREQGMSSKRFPSRMIFFRRVWNRFHMNDTAETAEDGAPEGGALSYDQIPWERLVKDSKLVQLEDKGLIPDSQFASIAQMEICQLTEEDRIGYNKDREVGFTGLCCRYCHGKPGFGRFFPSNVRNLEKTSARDTMVSHISLFCQSCPDEVKDAVLTLRRIESSRDGSSTMKGLIYGSGKMFFRRVWSRLHGLVAESDSTDHEEVSQPSLKRGAITSADLSRSCRGDRDKLRSDDNNSSDDSTMDSICDTSRKRKLEQPGPDRHGKKPKSASKSVPRQLDAPKGNGICVSNVFMIAGY